MVYQFSVGYHTTSLTLGPHTRSTFSDSVHVSAVHFPQQNSQSKVSSHESDVHLVSDKLELSTNISSSAQSIESRAGVDSVTSAKSSNYAGRFAWSDYNTRVMKPYKIMVMDTCPGNVLCLINVNLNVTLT